MNVSLAMACLLLLAPAVESGGEAVNSKQISADKAALAALQPFVGSWRGVGQPRRGSNRGAWTEKAQWAWKFADGRASLVFDAPDAKYFPSGKLLPGREEGTYDLIAQRRDPKDEVHFSGSVDKSGQLVLVAEGDDGPPEAPARISIRTVADDDRLLVLYEKRLGGDRFARLAEVGYTRRGASFAKGSGDPECIVTGGLGTIEVAYQGKKYYVCCTGCRDLFNDDPEGALADYRERKAAEREKEKAE